MDTHDMESLLRQYCQDYAPDSVNAYLKPTLLACDPDERTLALRCETVPCMTNPIGILHGGVSASCLDLSMGLLCRYYADGHMPLSVHIDVSYLRAVPLLKPLYLHAHILKLGRSLCFTEGYLALLESPNQRLVSATGTYDMAHM